MPEFWETSPIVEESQQRNWWDNSAIAESGIENQNQANENAGQIYDMAIESEIPFSESEEIFALTSPQVDRSFTQSPTLAKRFGKQYYNSTIGNVVTAIGTKSEIGKLNTEVKTAEFLRNEFRKKIESGQPVTADQVEFYAKPYEKWTLGWLFGSRRDPWLEKVWKDYEEGKLNINNPPSPQQAIQEFLPIRQAAQLTVEREAEARMEVPEAAGIGETIIDAAAGIAGFTTQVVLLKKTSPSMPEAVVWENINIANGGQFGHGAAMQLALGGINRAIPGTGFLPAVERGTVASALFGTTTYLGGGDTTEILVNMGIPFAFEGLGITQQKWAEYKNKKVMIESIKKKAPALSGQPDIVIDRAIFDLLTNVEYKTAEQLKTELKLGKKAPSISEELRQFSRRRRYDELLEKANSGNKKAMRELNDYVQGKNIPTYDELLEKAFSGDTSAFERLQIGDYQGGPSAQAELQIPKSGKPAGAAYRPPTPIQRIRENEPIVLNDLKPVTQKIDPKDLSKARERGFITSVREIYPELKIEGQYIPRDTDTLAIKARNLIRDDIIKAEKIARTGTDDISVAIISELIKHYSNEGATAKNPEIKQAMYEKAARIANESAAKLTELGRAVQAAAILGRLTPEGQVRFAAKEIQRYNEKISKKKGGIGGLKKKIPELKAEQAEYIMKEMAEINKIPEGKQKYIRFQKLQDYISDLVPTPLYKKLITTWKAGLLTGIKTHGLNILSNAFHAGTETVKDVPAAAVDKVTGYFTGRRTVTPTIKGAKKGAIEGFGRGYEYLKSGYSERDIGTKLDYQKISWDKNSPIQRGLHKYTESIFRLLGAGDQPFYYAAKLRSLYEQAKVSAINNGLKGKVAQNHIDYLMQNPTERMIELATKDAEAAVFINNTKLGDIARGIQRLPGGEIVVPFGRTPSAIAMQIVNYSPVGAVKTIIENIGKGRFDQRSFSQGIGRGLTGTAVLVIGAKLYQADLITLDYPKDEKERKLWELEGRQANSVKIGDDWRTIQSFGPAGNLLIVGGHFQRAFEENGSPTEAMSEALIGSGKSFTEQTFLRGVNQFVDALSDPERSAPSMFGNMASSVIPTIVSDVARATDIEERRAETVAQKFLVKIPGARQTLEPRINVLGAEKLQTANPLELMIDPTRPSKDISTPVVQELRRLWEAGWQVSPSQLGDKKGYEVLTPEENTELWRTVGQLTNKALNSIVNTEEYQKLPDEEKANQINQIVSESQYAAKAIAVANKLSKAKPDEKAELIFEMRKSGLAETELIPITLSKQSPRAVERMKKESIQ